MSDISTSLAVRDIKALDRTGGDTFTSVLLIKRIAERPTKTGNPFLMVELADKTLGIVGLGRIGKLVADRAKGFGELGNLGLEFSFGEVRDVWLLLFEGDV